MSITKRLKLFWKKYCNLLFLAINFFAIPHSLLLLLIFLASSWYQKAKIGLRMSLRNKNILIRPKKKSSLVSGNWPGENFFDHLPAPMSQMCMRIYSFCVQKNTHTSKKISISNFIPMNLRLFLVFCFKCRLYLKNLIKLIKKVFLQPPKWRFYSSPAFMETRVLFFLAVSF